MITAVNKIINKKTGLLELIQVVSNNRGYCITLNDFREAVTQAKRLSNPKLWDLFERDALIWWMGFLLSRVKLPGAVPERFHPIFKEAISDFMTIEWENVAYEMIVRYEDRSKKWD